MTDENQWYNQVPLRPQRHSSRRIWQHMVDHQVPTHSTLQDKQKKDTICLRYQVKAKEMKIKTK